MKTITKYGSSFGTLSAEYDLFYDHCDGCTRCARKDPLCAEGMKLLEHAVLVARRDWGLQPAAVTCAAGATECDA